MTTKKISREEYLTDICKYFDEGDTLIQEDYVITLRNSSQMILSLYDMRKEEAVYF